MALSSFSLGSLQGPRAEGAVQNLITTGTVSAAAFLSAYAQTKWADKKLVGDVGVGNIYGVDTAMLTGFLATVGGAMDTNGSWGGKHVANVGAGLLANYFTRLGMSVAGAKSFPNSPMGLPAGGPAFSVPANQSAWTAR